MKKLWFILTIFLPALACAQDTAKVIYGDARYMEATFKTKNNFQVYDIKKCSSGNCAPDGLFSMYADSAQKRKLYTGEIARGMREGVWSYFDKSGNTVCEEEYAAGKLIRYTIFNEGTEAYERTFREPNP
jgi:antitoxin component YwqK of YwqJK toxin-antitoxin module